MKGVAIITPFKQPIYQRFDYSLESFESLRKCFVVVTTDKAAKIFAFTCKIYYITKLLVELQLSNSKSETYLRGTYSIEEINQANASYCKRFDQNIREPWKLLPIMY